MEMVESSIGTGAIWEELPTGLNLVEVSSAPRVRPRLNTIMGFSSANTTLQLVLESISVCQACRRLHRKSPELKRGKYVTMRGRKALPCSNW